MLFPLPLALVGSDGSVKRLNKLFSDTFDASCLESESLRKVLHDPYGSTHVPISLHCNGRTSQVFVRAVNISDKIMLVFEMSEKIGHRAKLAELQNRITELEKTSATDCLTGAWNRVHFDRTIAIELNRSIRYHQPLALIFFDIDHFKHVNDTYGHAVGDAVLRKLVSVVSMNIRPSDMLFRWGGEEFAILAPVTAYPAAANLAEKLRVQVGQHTMDIAGNITISLGIAEHVSGESESAWFKRADAALYAAKNGGRNKVVVDPQGNSDAWTAEQGTAILHLKWHESYDCGEPTIDQEHRKLFALANELFESTFARNENPAKFDLLLKDLLEHIEQHFADEEAILARHHYADLDVQVRAHRILIEHALRLQAAAAEGNIRIGDLVNFLADEVVAKHILKVDREFYPLFKKASPSQT